MWLGARCTSCGCNPNSYTGLDYDKKAETFEYCPECGSSEIEDVFEDYSEWDEIDETENDEFSSQNDEFTSEIETTETDYSETDDNWANAPLDWSDVPF